MKSAVMLWYCQVRLRFAFSRQLVRNTHSSVFTLMTNGPEMPPTFQDVLEASRRIRPYIHNTPVMTSSTVDEMTGRNVYFKAEYLQKTGSFKPRGAMNAIKALLERDPSVPGVTTYSSGNHGMSVAWAAQKAGLKAVVVVPHWTTAVKCEAIQSYGAQLVYCQPTQTSRFETCESVSKERQFPAILPHDNFDVIAGQGTIISDFLDEVPQLDAVLVPAGGGSMAAGTAIAAKHIKPSIKVFIVEPKGKELEKSLRAGERLWSNPPQFVNTIAEGFRIQPIAQMTFPIIKDLVEKDVFTVTDEEIIESMKFMWQRMKCVIETTAAAGVSAAMSEKMRRMNLKNIGVILCGGNVDLDRLPWQNKL